MCLNTFSSLICASFWKCWFLARAQFICKHNRLNAFLFNYAQQRATDGSPTSIAGVLYLINVSFLSFSGNICVESPLCLLCRVSYFTHSSSSIAFLWARCDREGSFGMMCCYEAHLHHVKVVGITVQMPHNGAPDCRSIHLCLGQSGITHSCTINIHRSHSGIKNEDYLTKCGLIFFLPLCLLLCCR